MYKRQYLDEWVRAGGCPDLEPFGSLTGLLPAWTGELIWKADNRFIWEMIDSPETLNVPILVCEDDCDLSCIVIMARIRKTENLVFWEKLGRLTHENEDFNLEKRSGIDVYKRQTGDLAPHHRYHMKSMASSFSGDSSAMKYAFCTFRST